ncbi:hypothetical protein NIES2101_42050 [Calothrix sp. HK-06]|nr:hypothetical protein NIES2101_42050 [Calothrix sp. HK-06]
MKIRKLTGSIIVASTLFTSTLPANANPFGNANGGIFKPIPAGNTTSTPATTPNGNSEVQGLGDHQSWVDQKTLANDPRALCSDVSLGNNTRTSASELALANSTSTRSSSSKSHNDGGGGGFSFLGIGANGSGSTQGSQNNSDSKDTRTNRNEKNSNSSSNVVQGRNCDAFVNSAAARDMNFQDNLTRRYEIKTGRRGQQVNQLLENK